jgi:AcrR family transcriptional regulator
VGKAALYRRWNSKQDMTVDVVSRLSVEMAEARDEGSFRADIRAALAAVTRWLDDPRTGKIVMDLCTVALRNPAFADALTEHIGVPRRTLLGTIFERARERGDLLPNADLDLLLDMLGGIVHWRLIIRRERVDGRYLDEVTDVIVAAFAK